MKWGWGEVCRRAGEWGVVWDICWPDSLAQGYSGSKATTFSPCSLGTSPYRPSEQAAFVKIVLHSPSDLLHIILIAVDLVYMPVFFQRFLRWRLNTHIIRSRKRRKGGNLWGRKSKVKSKIRSGTQFLSETSIHALAGPRVLPLSFW